MKKYLFRLIELLILFLVLYTFIWGVLNYEQLQNFAEEEIRIYGWIGILLIGFLTDLIPQYVPPHIGIFSAPLISLNIWYAFVLVSVGSILGSLLGYEIGNLSKEKSDLKKLIFGAKRLKKVEKGLNDYGKWFIAIAAISPLPYVPIIIGNFHIKRRCFYFYGLIPRIIGFFILSSLIYLGFY